MSTNNAAERLHIILEEINGREPVEALAEIFNIDAEDRTNIYKSYASIYSLCNECHKLIEKLDSNSRLTKFIDDAIASLNKTYLYKKNFECFSFSESTLAGISVMGCLIKSSDVELSETDLRNLQERVVDLITDINQSQINNDLRFILLKHLNEMLGNIMHYTLYGSEPIKNQIEQCAGSIWLQKPLINSDEEKKICKKILEFILTSISFFNSNVPLIEYVEKLLK